MKFIKSKFEGQSVLTTLVSLTKFVETKNQGKKNCVFHNFMNQNLQEQCFSIFFFKISLKTFCGS